MLHASSSNKLWISSPTSRQKTCLNSVVINPKEDDWNLVQRLLENLWKHSSKPWQKPCKKAGEKPRGKSPQNPCICFFIVQVSGEYIRACDRPCNPLWTKTLWNPRITYGPDPLLTQGHMDFTRGHVKNTQGSTSGYVIALKHALNFLKVTQSGGGILVQPSRFSEITKTWCSSVPGLQYCSLLKLCFLLVFTMIYTFSTHFASNLWFTACTLTKDKLSTT